MVEYKLSNTPKLERAFFGVSYVSNNIILVIDKENENDLKPNYILSPGMGNIDTISDEGILNSKNLRLFAENFLYLLLKMKVLIWLLNQANLKYF